MNFSLSKILASLKASWDNLSSGQRLITVLLPSLILGGMLYFVWTSANPVYTALFQSITASEAGSVASKLKELKVPYQLADGGTTVLVPQTQVAEVRIQLASAGIPTGSKFSFANIADVKFGETDADRKIRITLGLQDELETTLRTMTAIEDARVHLAMPEQSLFVKEDKAPTAAVTIKIRPGNQLDEEQISGIANLLASSIEGLKPENVTMIDTSGQLLSQGLDTKTGVGLSGSQNQMQQRVQDNLELSAQTMLDKALGKGKSVVRVVSTLDFDQVEVKKETFGDSVLRSKSSREDIANSGSGGTTGVVGSSANVPATNGSLPTYLTSSGTTSGATSGVASKTSEVQETYEINKTQETRLINPGNIKRLSVSILLDGQSVDANSVQTVKDVVTTAVGLSIERGDQIQVASIPFKTEAEPSYLAPDKQSIVQTSQVQSYIKYGVAGVGGLMMLLIMISVLRKPNKKIASANLSANLAATAYADSGMMTHNNQVEEIYKQKMKAANQSNPDDVAKVIKLWLQDDTR